jgi:hypothetical protein
MRKHGWKVWRDEVSIGGGAVWHTALDTGLRKADAVLVLVSAKSVKSEWVTYEYAFATGAAIPVVAVSLDKTDAPGPIRKFQAIAYPGPDAAARIHAGLLDQASRAAESLKTTPMLFARFYEEDGEIYRLSNARVPAIAMELWVEHAPPRTTEVAFEVLEGVEGSTWTVKRSKRTQARQFLTDEGFNLWGDVDIVARGRTPGGRDWTTRSRVYDALVRYYANVQPSADVRKGLKQIRDN